MSGETTTVEPKKLSTSDRWRYYITFLMFALLWMGGLAIVASVLLPQHLKDVTGDSNTATAVYTALNSVTAFASLISNLLFGNLSDRTRSRFGRRTPWILGGGIVGGISLFLTGVFDNPWIVGFWYCVCMFGLNAMIAPIIAALSDRVPEDMRASMSAFMSLGTTIGQSMGTIIAAFFINMVVPGFLVAGILMGISGLAAVLIWPKEPSAADLPPVKSGFADLIKSFTPPTKGARDFWLAFLGRTAIIFGYYMILNYQLYILQDYIGLSKEASATTIAFMSTLIMVFGLIGSLGSGFISDKIGRRKLPVAVSAITMGLGFLLPWIFKTEWSMFGFAILAGFGYAVYGAVDQALNIDVLPNPDEAGKDLGILNIATTLGQMVGPILTGVIVIAVGYQMVFPVAIAFEVLAVVFIYMIRSTK
ncbi:MFS transporter [Alloscardovia criceti]|uniref:MFS transporter n=1 Tax=Alloscardovia criceti TaxID=356828 RepID=UPI00036CC8F3|nr:MFS transporter [Alloscardovia criceti]